jgi:hypothetical protein
VLGGGICAYGWVTILLYCLWLNEHTHFSNNRYSQDLEDNNYWDGKNSDGKYTMPIFLGIYIPLIQKMPSFQNFKESKNVSIDFLNRDRNGGFLIKSLIHNSAGG